MGWQSGKGKSKPSQNHRGETVAHWGSGNSGKGSGSRKWQGGGTPASHEKKKMKTSSDILEAEMDDTWADDAKEEPQEDGAWNDKVFRDTAWPTETYSVSTPNNSKDTGTNNSDGGEKVANPENVARKLAFDAKHEMNETWEEPKEEWSEEQQNGVGAFLDGMTKDLASSSYYDIWTDERRGLVPEKSTMSETLERISQNSDLKDVASVLGVLDRKVEKTSQLQVQTLRQQMYLLSQEVTAERWRASREVVFMGLRLFDDPKAPKSKTGMQILSNLMEHRMKSCQRVMNQLGLSSQHQPQTLEAYSSVKASGELSEVTIVTVSAPWIRTYFTQQCKDHYSSGLEEIFWDKNGEITSSIDGNRYGRELSQINEDRGRGWITVKPQVALFDRVKGLPLKLAMYCLDEHFSVPSFRPKWKEDQVVLKKGGEVVVALLFNVQDATCDLWLNSKLELEQFRKHFVEALAGCDVARASVRPPWNYDAAASRKAFRSVAISKLGSFPWTMTYHVMPKFGFDRVVHQFAKHMIQDESDLD